MQFGRWSKRDSLENTVYESSILFVHNNPILLFDVLGEKYHYLSVSSLFWWVLTGQFSPDETVKNAALQEFIKYYDYDSNFNFTIWHKNHEFKRSSDGCQWYCISLTSEVFGLSLGASIKRREPWELPPITVGIGLGKHLGVNTDMNSIGIALGTPSDNIYNVTITISCAPFLLFVQYDKNGCPCEKKKRP